ncbi:MAG: class I SAM-dependent rRNA methyltransferase [Planctomycetota bacterium]
MAPTSRNTASSEASGAAGRKLAAALTARTELISDPQITAYRVLNAAADGIAGLVIEKLDQVLIVQLHEERLRLSEEDVRRLCDQARRQLKATAVYRKDFPKDRTTTRERLERLHTDAQPWIGSPSPAELIVRERDLRFIVRPYDGYSTGLFLEQRNNRQQVRALASGRCVLNTFAYTCGFAVAAALGGASETISVDISSKALEWGRRNFAANDLDLAGHGFVRADVFDYFRRARRRGQTFDVIVLDPPTFARTKRPRRVFTLTTDLERLITSAIELLIPGGHLLLSTNHRPTTLHRLHEVVVSVAGNLNRREEISAPPRLPVDFQGDRDYAKSILARIY